MEAAQDLKKLYFRRKFSLTMFKNKQFRLSEMSFFKDFTQEPEKTRGNLYPVLDREGKPDETVADGRYIFQTTQTDARIIRLMGGYFPYATYVIRAEALEGNCGFSFQTSTGCTDIFFCQKNGNIVCTLGDQQLTHSAAFTPGTVFMVTCREEELDIYVNSGVRPVYIGTLTAPLLKNAACYHVFSRCVVGLYVAAGTVILSQVYSCMDCGISQADIRPIRYENGGCMLENGKIYLTMSVRMEKGFYQGIFSWVPGTSEFELTGAVFFDAGDGYWANDVASSLLYHREEKKWYLWVCSFKHQHRLGHASFDGDVRFGLHVVDITLMEPMGADKKDTDFLGKQGDEDPDFLYNEKTGKWLMAICRLVDQNYRYFLFESEQPFEGYRCIAHAESGSETGGSLIPVGQDLYFACGSDFNRRAVYHLYRLPDMTSFSLLSCDYDDGGFRGWGTVIPIRSGSRTNYYWLTFDRNNGSDYQWSYGNLYGFLADAQS